MTHTEIIKFARQAGFKYADVEGIWITAGFWDNELTAFAKLIEQAQREKSAETIRERNND
jgi:hypothetical protein